MSDDARRIVLDRIARATADVRDDDPPAAHAALDRDYRQRDDLNEPGRLDLLEARLVDYGVDVVRTRASDLTDVLTAELTRRRARRVVVPKGAPGAWVAAVEGRVRLRDDADPTLLDDADATLSGCAVAVADTGSIVLDGGPGQGRRAATLVPDVHLCVVPASRVVGLVPEAVARLHDAVAAGAPLTWISGPSATSDIEMIRVAGVHGPRTLVVFLVRDA
ncbi:MAG: LUD domain-containing protein [Trueperaceae bacterium]|nr:LUD domain-containing protein [Trueperaceae bacterium]